MREADQSGSVLSGSTALLAAESRVIPPDIIEKLDAYRAARDKMIESLRAKGPVSEARMRRIQKTLLAEFGLTNSLK